MLREVLFIWKSKGRGTAVRIWNKQRMEVDHSFVRVICDTAKNIKVSGPCPVDAHLPRDKKWSFLISHHCSISFYHGRLHSLYIASNFSEQRKSWPWSLIPTGRYRKPCPCPEFSDFRAGFVSGCIIYIYCILWYMDFPVERIFHYESETLYLKTIVVSKS